jgi:SH3/ankyrin repeat-containing protein
MHKSCILGNDLALKCLLELGSFAEVTDTRGLTPLYLAILHAGSLPAIEYLLFNGSPLNVRDDSLWTELHHACKLGLAQHVDHLIYYGADMNARNSVGNTPLHVCAVHGKVECARVLLFRGCERWARNLGNQTPFDSAVIAGNQEVAELIRGYREVDTQMIKEKPFYNTKRRSVYLAASGDKSEGHFCDKEFRFFVVKRFY